MYWIKIFDIFCISKISGQFFSSDKKFTKLPVQTTCRGYLHQYNSLLKSHHNEFQYSVQTGEPR